jgi:hypothetical protein
MHSNFREFFLKRIEDVSGTSGTGIVAQGIILRSGRCVLEWNSELDSIEIVKDLQTLLKIHSHNGKTKLYLGNPSIGGVREVKLGDVD